MKEKERLFITVIGEDKKGIVAKISTLLYELDINIEDISQKITEGFFVMTMLVDIKDSRAALEEISLQLKQIGQELRMEIQIQHENILKMMHRV
ncbi:MAG: ACT domain-containing protein [Deltaproteobacteria bacterium]|nr:ACT domain-containing protein [Deltaproteobacteria bacterium]MBW2052266.1 ACT domain-containing protein [Deltaproteobacteria bacterium]MBW2140832.1 ACT domain-containing protein [Deltaproteobacteria bacterium]MBW2323643.1 ACT domain-containing protein [Deltaproteobacteria bacterium]